MNLSANYKLSTLKFVSLAQWKLATVKEAFVILRRISRCQYVEMIYVCTIDSSDDTRVSARWWEPEGLLSFALS